MLRDYTDIIFENYEQFLKEHSSEMSTASGALEMLSSDGAFRAYMNTLSEGLDPGTKSVVMAVAQREREMLLEEGMSFGPSAAVVGYNVTYFPILTDIYSDPIISQIATTYPIGKPMITIPKIKVRASVNNTDGSTSNWVIPRDTHLVRGSSMNITLSPNISNNLFILGGVPNTNDEAIINKRYFMITSITLKDNSATPNNHTIPLSIRADARGQISTKFTFTDSNHGNTQIEGSLIGSVDFNSGTVQFSVNCAVPTSLPGVVFETVSATTSVVFSPKRSDIGRVKVSLDVQGWDVNIDVKDDFEIELASETIDDYRDIYNIDLVRTLSLAIKQQMLLNKDFELGYYLGAYEAEMRSNGASRLLDFVQYRSINNSITPNSVMDIFKSVIPMISSVSRTIRKNFRADPQYLLCGLKTASMLESLQNFVVNFPESRNGEGGFQANSSHLNTAGPISFRKQTILASSSLPEGKIYNIYKAPSDDLSRATIIDLVYKPLYMIDEVTNSLKRTFVKSRTTLEFTNIEAMGYIELQNFERYIG